LRKYYITSEIEKGTSENVINQIVGYTDNSVMIKKIKQQSFWEYGDDE
jgi:ribosomal protein S17E